MGFRTLEISHAAKIHIKDGQLEIATEEGIALMFFRLKGMRDNQK